MQAIDTGDTAVSDEITHRLRCRYPLGPMVNGEPELGWRDFGGPAPAGIVLPTPIMLEAANEIEQLRAENDALREALRALIRGYVNALENGRDRIVMLGGQCDPVQQMEADDPYLLAARKALAQAAR